MTETELQADLIYWNRQLSLRKIADELYAGDVSHGVIDRCIKGVFPKRATIRAALGLTPLKHIPACACGEVHTSKRCPNAPRPERRKRYRPDVALVKEGDKDIISGLSAQERRIALVEYAILKEGNE